MVIRALTITLLFYEHSRDDPPLMADPIQSGDELRDGSVAYPPLSDAVPRQPAPFDLKGRTMTQAIKLITGALAVILTTGTLHAQAPRAVCGARDQVVETLTGRFGEVAQSWGMGPGNRIVEVFASEETGTWTITVTDANGTTCLVASGRYWENLAPVPVGEAL